MSPIQKHLFFHSNYHGFYRPPFSTYMLLCKFLTDTVFSYMFLKGPLLFFDVAFTYRPPFFIYILFTDFFIYMLFTGPLFSFTCYLQAPIFDLHVIYWPPFSFTHFLQADFFYFTWFLHVYFGSFLFHLHSFYRVTTKHFQTSTAFS